jgi:Tol biopolymer transport system component
VRGLLAAALAAVTLAGVGDARTQLEPALLTYFLGSPFRPPGGGGLCASAGPGTAAIRLTDPVNAQRPSWSPDGSRVAFFRTPRQDLDESDVLVADADGGHARDITARYGGDKSDPAWSPDGRRIAFVLRDAAGTRLVTAGPDGSDLRRVQGASAGASGFMGLPAWSPDGTQLAFSMVRLPDVSGLFVIPASGGTPRLLAPDSGGAAWSPDGDEIAFTHAGQEIVVARLDGTDARVVASARDGGEMVGFPAWSPDGGTIAFSRQSSGLSRVMTVSADGTGERAVAGTRELGAFFPAWRVGPAPSPRVRRPCVVRGTGHADRLVGTAAGDVLLGESGNDVILGRGGPDLIIGGLGRDVVRGGAGNDWLYTLDGAADVVDGGPGLDRADADARDRLSSVERREPPW